MVVREVVQARDPQMGVSQTDPWALNVTMVRERLISKETQEVVNPESSLYEARCQVVLSAFSRHDPRVASIRKCDSVSGVKPTTPETRRPPGHWPNRAGKGCGIGGIGVLLTAALCGVRGLECINSVFPNAAVGYQPEVVSCLLRSVGHDMNVTDRLRPASD